jgi:hypothetical protein
MHRHAIYKDPRPHEVTVPRRGDVAEIIRNHCRAESGMLVAVINDPHLAMATCGFCGQEIREYMVEVEVNHPDWNAVPRPHFYPLSWLRRVEV